MIRGTFAALAVLLGSSCALAFDVPVDSQGNYNPTGMRVSASDYTAGTAGVNERRGYFVFDLSVYPNAQSVATATLTINTFGVTFAGSRTLTIYDVSQANIAGLQAGTTNTAIFNDLGSGTVYATRSYSSADANDPITIDLSAAVSDINNVFGTGFFAVGFQLTTNGSNQRVFAGSGVNADNQLTLTLVPEPSSFALLAMGLGVVYRRRRARQAAPRP